MTGPELTASEIAAFRDDFARLEAALQAAIVGQEPVIRELLTAFLRADRRQKPVIPALGRDHSFNRSLGRLRAAFFPRKGPVAAGRPRKRPAA